MRRPCTTPIHARREVKIREAAFVLQVRVDRVAGLAEEIRLPDGTLGVFFIGGRRSFAVDALRLYTTKADVVDGEDMALTPIRILDAIARRQITIPRFKSRNAASPPFEEMLPPERGGPPLTT